MANWIPKIEYGTIPTTIYLRLPPEGDPIGERITTTKKTTKSLTGYEVNQLQFNEERFNLNFTMLNKEELSALRNFFINHAGKGGEFNYYIHSDEYEYRTFTLSSNTFNPIRVLADGTGDFYYSLSLIFRRIYGPTLFSTVDVRRNEGAGARLTEDGNRRILE